LKSEIPIEINEKVPEGDEDEMARIFEWIAGKGIRVFIDEDYGLLRALKTAHATDIFAQKVKKISIGIHIEKRFEVFEKINFLLPSTKAEHFQVNLTVNIRVQ
jgi:hypothetical protein